MSGDQPPPPGWQPPQQEPVRPLGCRTGTGGVPGPVPGAVPAADVPGQPGAGFAVPMPVAHKPGAIPLRPLVLSDIFDGAFRIIRYNPRATIGAAVLVSAVAMIVPIVAGIATGSTGGLSPDADRRVALRQPAGQPAGRASAGSWPAPSCRRSACSSSPG